MAQRKIYVWWTSLCSVCGQRHEHKTRMRSGPNLWLRLKWRRGVGALLTATAPMRSRTQEDRCRKRSA